MEWLGPRPELAAELARLLPAPARRLAARRLPGARRRRRSRPERPPERIGPYRIVRELGRGGMGRVFLAEEEAEDFRRTVALKVIHRPGLDDEAIRRFRDEVRILASLEHPGIARFLDGGRAPDGTWFLALEHVEGEDLIGYAATRSSPFASASGWRSPSSTRSSSRTRRGRPPRPQAG